MRLIQYVLFACALALTSAESTVVAQEAQSRPQQSATTRMVPFSGILTDAAGTPLVGSHVITFALFDDAEAGSLLWTETQAITVDNHGRYLAYLGAAVPFPLEIFRSEQARWLQVSAAGRDFPRAMLAAVPYALNAVDADTLGGEPLSSFVRARAPGIARNTDALVDSAAVDGSGVAGQLAKWDTDTTLSSSSIAETPTGRIGIGLTDPTVGGILDSVFTAKSPDNNTAFAVVNEARQRRFALNTLATGGFQLYDGRNGRWNPGLTQVEGRVGLGMDFPGAIFDVVSDEVMATGIRAKTTGTAGNALTGIASSGFAVFGTVGGGPGYAGVFYGKVHMTGPTGIGTGTPADTLDVKGDIRVGTNTTGCVKDADATVIAGTCSSDLRLKEDVRPFARSLEAVAQLQPVYFNWRTDEFPDRHLGRARTFGLIAQDVETVLPELVTTGADGYKAVRYNQLTFYMLQSIKDLKNENDTVRMENASLEKQVMSLEERLRRLELLAGK